MESRQEATAKFGGSVIEAKIIDGLLTCKVVCEVMDALSALARELVKTIIYSKCQK